MQHIATLAAALAVFTLVSLASARIGDWFRRFHLPLITGFMVTGVLAGPSVLAIVPEDALPRLRFIDEIALGFIAFAAGGELFLKQLRGRLAGIWWVSTGLVVVTLLLGTLMVVGLRDVSPFLVDISPAAVWSTALLAAAVLVARSPSSAIAIVKELRARGPFTQTILGVTVIGDVVVIVLFAGAMAMADALLAGTGVSPGFALLLLAELIASTAVGAVVWKLLCGVMASRLPVAAKTLGVLAVGWGVFLLSAQIRVWSHEFLSFEFLLEPLYICMVAGFLVTNFSRHRGEFQLLMTDAGPPVYTVFFTLTGASLELDVLMTSWFLALTLFGVRLLAIGIGAAGGGMLAGLPARHNRLSWMAYITQAGVGLGLAKEVAVEFPAWGETFATVMIGVIVLNQVVGPPLMKLALQRVGEARPRGRHGTRERERRAIVFGLEDQSLALARQLGDHGWEVTIATRNAEQRTGEPHADVTLRAYEEISVDQLRDLGAEQAEAIVCLLSDEENLRICELAYQHFGTDSLVVRIHDREISERFDDLNALIVDPSTAFVSLLDHLVRSPVATSLLLGVEPDQELMEMEVRNVELHGVALRDLKLPLDTLVVAVHRDGRMLVSHGYTRLRRGDRITALVGSADSRRELELRVEG